MAQKKGSESRIVPALIFGSAAYWIYSQSGPALNNGEIIPIPAMAASAAGISLFVGLAQGTKALVDIFDWLEAKQSTGLRGTAGFIKSIKELGNDYKRKGLGPFWGAWKEKTEIIADYESIAMTCGTSGSGKSSGTVIPTVLSIPHSKTIPDFKEGSLACQLAESLRKRGETVRILNFANKNTNILGESDAYNPAHIGTDCFKREGGLLEVIEIHDEEALHIYPEPSDNGGSQSENSYFRNGSRFLISWVNLTTRLIEGDLATLGDSAMMLMDRESMVRHALWACGRLPVQGGGE